MVIINSTFSFSYWLYYCFMLIISFFVLLGGFHVASFIIHLYNLTLIDLKFIFSIGAVGMIVLPILLKDMGCRIAKWSWKMERYRSLMSEKDYINQTYFIFLFSYFPVIGFGLFLSTFLYFNLNLPTQNITEKIQTPILEVRTTYNSRKYGGSGQADGKKATVVIKGYSKDIKFPLESEIQEGQLLSFSVRKGYFGFDVIEKL